MKTVKVKAFPFDSVCNDESKINNFLDSVDVLEHGIKMSSAGNILIMYLEKETPEEIAENKKKDEEKKVDMTKMPEFTAFDHKVRLIDMLKKSMDDQVSRTLELHVMTKVRDSKSKTTKVAEQREINVIEAQRKVDEKGVEVLAIEQAIKDLDEGKITFPTLK